MINVISPTQQLAGFQEKIQFEVLRRLHKTPEVSQRALANDLGISLGSINFCLQALVKKGCIKMDNFSRSAEKFRYVYLLTPTGLAEKSKLTSRFLKQKMTEYEALKRDIENLKIDLASAHLESGAPCEIRSHSQHA
jgi:EPS-associated MarR family transcriptional regulator